VVGWFKDWRLSWLVGMLTILSWLVGMLTILSWLGGMLTILSWLVGMCTYALLSCVGGINTDGELSFIFAYTSPLRMILGPENTIPKCYFYIVQFLYLDKAFNVSSQISNMLLYQ
jgi:hypothetical protein